MLHSSTHYIDTAIITVSVTRGREGALTRGGEGAL